MKSLFIKFNSDHHSFCWFSTFYIALCVLFLFENNRFLDRKSSFALKALNVTIPKDFYAGMKRQICVLFSRIIKQLLKTKK